MSIADILFPSICVGCGCLGVQICAHCAKDMRPIDKDWCLYCGNSTPSPIALCPHCAGKHETLPVLSFWYYESIVSRAIWSMKYKQNKQLIHEMFLHLRPTSLAKILLITERHKNTILVPVPLHPNRERERGYNQSSYITRLLSALTHIPITEHAIERVRETLPQAQCKSKKERLHNIHGAFLVKEPSALEGKTIMLVDDVVTTGSTIREITREIHKHTSSSTLALCLAREEDSEKYHRI